MTETVCTPEAAPALAKSDQNLVWLDCEMTGLDPDKGVDVDTPTITTMAQWVVDGAISEEMVYNLTKALWEKGAFVLRKKGEQAAEAPSGAEIMAQAHVKGKDVTLNTALNGVAIPLHPGALKFYREKGLK